MNPIGKKVMPEARKKGLVVQELADELLVYDRDNNKAHCLNSTAALVWKYCDGKTAISEIAHAIEGDLNAPVCEDLVWLGVEQLNNSKLLLGGARLSSHKSGLSRREVMKRIGLAAAVVLPAVTSIIAPSAAHAANCRPSGTSCGTSAQCCSGVCNAGTCA